ncbi:MAG: acetoin utilization deacetylase AcuC-like enzyme [Pseudohongiellaceae bacterium]|jgi:acetoin utilization deacetylase AcuC-like enzyme
MTTLILRDNRFLDHDAGPGHLENRGRLDAVHASLDSQPFSGTTTEAPPLVDRKLLLGVHESRHIDRVEATAGRAPMQLDPDTSTCALSWTVARLAAGAACRGAEAVLVGEHHGALALVRPPGHHAEYDQAMGFCLFNNVAVAAQHALTSLGCQRVAIIDPDVHHGNGTQSSFWGRSDVLYVSSHRFPFYPGSGAHNEVGAGAGAGYTLNLPMPPGLGDADLLYLYETVVEPVLLSYRPELIIISAGFDTWHNDPIGGMSISAQGYAGLFALFRRWADACCPGRLLNVLEGGYDPAGVVAGVRATITACDAASVPDVNCEGAASERVQALARQIRAVQAPYWPVLR